MQFVRIMTRVTYRGVVKPLLFRYQPDNVHEGLIRVAKWLQAVPGFTVLGRWLMAPKPSPQLRQDICGITFDNPVGLSAGFDKNIELQPTMRMIGCGFMTGGSVTRRPRAGNPRPWFYRLPKSRSLVVHAGLANQGIDKITTNVQRHDNVRTDMPLMISVAVVVCDDACTTDNAIAEACETLQIIQHKRLAQMVEINISCPNAQDGQPFTQLDNLQKLLESIDARELRLPIFIKMPNKPSWGEFEPILDEVAKHGVQGVTIANLVKDREGVTLQDELPDSIKGGLSGKPTYDRSNELIRQTYQKYGDKLVIIGVGGIFSAEDAYEKIRCGASLVALITGMIFEGPQLMSDVIEGLQKEIRRQGCSNITEVVGIAVKSQKKSTKGLAK